MPPVHQNSHNSPRPRWYNEDIRHEKRELRRLERKWRKRKLQVDRDAYMIQNKKLLNLLNCQKRSTLNLFSMTVVLKALLRLLVFY